MRDRSIQVKGELDRAGDVGETNVLFELWRVSRAAGALLEAALATAGLSGDEFGIYSVLAAGEATTPTELARWMSAPATTVSSHIKRLEARGHLTRTPATHDGRSVLLQLTPAGRRTHEAATAVYLPLLTLVTDDLGGREPGVRKALLTLRHAVDASRRQPRPEA